MDVATSLRHLLAPPPCATSLKNDEHVNMNREIIHNITSFVQKPTTYDRKRGRVSVH